MIAKRNFFSLIILVLIVMGCGKSSADDDVMVDENKDPVPIIHYNFETPTGIKVFDATTNQNHGNLIGGQWWIEDNKPTIAFDGNDYIDIPITSASKFNTLEHGSISIQFKFRNFNGKIQPIVYFGESSIGVPHNSLIIEVGHGNNLNNRKLYFTIVNASFCFDSNEDLDENTWYHFVAVVGPEGNTGYLNGVELTHRHYNLGSNASYTDFFLSVPTKEIFTLGYGRYGLSNDFYFFDGFISDFRVYKEVLSREEVQKIYTKL
ncbi:MAG: LamG domain-containing protein [Bacteroidetes bacterium]|nr:LamG domain-containing protein [Bacteroidota bacterium]